MLTQRSHGKISLSVLLVGFFATTSSAYAQFETQSQAGVASTAGSGAAKLYGSASAADSAGYMQGMATVQAPLRAPRPTGLYAKHRFLTGQNKTTRLDALTSSGQLTDKTKQLLHKAFAKMTCIEYNELGANYYTVEHNYKPVALTQTIALPGFWGGYVQVFGDGKHYITIDPRSLDTWVASASADVTSKSSWKKLLHVKDR